MTLVRGVAVGGGTVLLAVWLVSVVSTGAPAPRIDREAPVQPRVQPLFQFDAQVARLRPRAPDPKRSPASRNPFTFGPDRPMPLQPDASARAAYADGRLGEPAQPSADTATLSLIGIAERKVGAGVQRVAILSAAGQLFLAGVGETVAFGYVVESIDADAVDLTGAAGQHLHLMFR